MTIKSITSMAPAWQRTQPKPPLRSYTGLKLYINNQSKLKNWGIGIKPTAANVLQRFNMLEWVNIVSLQGLDVHLRALTDVTVAHFNDCAIFSSVEALSPLTGLGDSLVELKIDKAETSPAALEHLLVGLPHLGRFIAKNLCIESKEVFAPGDHIPQFFMGGKEMALLLIGNYLPEHLAWIPLSAKFSKLTIGTECIVHDAKLQPGSKWIENSYETLKYLNLSSENYSSGTFGPLDLSTCKSLKTLECLGKYAHSILPYANASELSEVFLHVDLATDLGPLLASLYTFARLREESKKKEPEIVFFLDKGKAWKLRNDWLGLYPDINSFGAITIHGHTKRGVCSQRRGIKSKKMEDNPCLSTDINWPELHLTRHVVKSPLHDEFS